MSASPQSGRVGVLLVAFAGATAIAALAVAASSSVPEPTVLPVARRRRGHGDPGPYLVAIRRAAARHPQLRGRLPYLLAVLDQESRFDPRAVSRTGAAGIAQFTKIGRQEVQRLMAVRSPAPRNGVRAQVVYTWADRFHDSPAIAARLRTFSLQDAFDPEIAIEAAALYLAALLTKWQGNLEAAATEYNAGGVPAGLVAHAGSHRAALHAIMAIPEERRSQAATYAPEVLANRDYFASAGIAGDVTLTRVARGLSAAA